MSNNKIGVVGAGTMGTGIAQVAAMSGSRVWLYDTAQGSLTKAKKEIDISIARFVEKGKLDKNASENASGNISYIHEIGVLCDADLIIEAITENLAIKQNVFSQIEKIVSKKCILATNTSSLSVTSIASVCKVPERMVGAHFFNPVPLMALAEIVPAVQTGSGVVAKARKIINGLGKITVTAKDTPGFIVNRIARPFYGEAIRIYEEGIADFATIDRVMKEIGGFRMGPFELMDLIGNDINYEVTRSVWEQFYYEPRYKPSFTQKRMVEAGWLGRKTKRGYYDYREDGQNPIPKSPVPSHLSKDIFNRILCMLINEAADALYYSIASRDDIDLAMTQGVNYPKGLLRWADELGIPEVIKTLRQLQEEYCEDRYRPSLLLKKMERDRRTFFPL